MIVLARDKNLGISAYDVPYTNLVWTRRWYDFGEFQMQMPLSVYDPEWGFLTSPDHDEVGMVQKVQFSSEDGGTVLLSGFFAEKALDRAVVTPLGGLGEQLVLQGKGSASIVARNFISLYYMGHANGYLNVGIGDLSKTKEISYNLNGEMGTTLMNSLNQVGMSMILKLGGSGCLLYPIEGRDLSVNQTTYQPVILSSAYGDFSNITYSRDDSAYKNKAYFIFGEEEAARVSSVTRANETVPQRMESGMFVEVSSTYNRAGSSQEFDDAYKAASNDARDKLYDCNVVYDIEATLNDPEILGDLFDLGDTITVRVDEMGVSADTRLVEVTETYNSSGKSVQVGFGSKRISNIRRATI